MTDKTATKSGATASDPGFELIVEQEGSKKIFKIKFPGKSVITVNEEDNIISLQTPGKNTVELNDRNRNIVLTDQNRNKIVMDSSGITIESARDLTFKANEVKIAAAGSCDIQARSNVKLKGLNVEANADVSIRLKGSSSAELLASGLTMVKGTIVMIN